MGQDSKIEWCHHTANLWWGCQEVHEGCDNCYARAWDKRTGGDHWGANKSRSAIRGVWKSFEKYQKAARAAGEIHRVFVGSMMDIFEVSKPLTNRIRLEGDAIYTTTGEVRDYFFRRVVPRCPNLLFLLLTKRPGNILSMIPEEWKTTPPANMMYGCSVVNQETADRDIPKLLQVPGHRFLSCEPLLGPVDLYKIPASLGTYYSALHGCEWRPGSMPEKIAATNRIDWAIVGGESGPDARECSIEWLRSLREQCAAAGVACFVKQLGAKPYRTLDFKDAPNDIKLPFRIDDAAQKAWLTIRDKKGGDMQEWPEDLRVRQIPEVTP